MEWLNTLERFYQNNPPWFIVGAASTLALLIALVVLIRYLIKSRDVRRVQRTVKAIAPTYLRDVVMPDGMDGYVSIDYLVLTPGGILVLDIQNYNGLLFGGERVDQWTQMVKNRSFKFENPLHDNENRVVAVRALAADVPVIGRVVFSNLGQFPKGIPTGVSMLDTLKQDVSDLLNGGDVPPSLKTAWEGILRAVFQDHRK